MKNKSEDFLNIVLFVILTDETNIFVSFTMNNFNIFIIIVKKGGDYGK